MTFDADEWDDQAADAVDQEVAAQQLPGRRGLGSRRLGGIGG